VNVSKEDWSYIAGFVDGEGSLMLSPTPKSKWCPFQPRLRISNTNLDVIKWLQQKIGGFIKTREETNNRKQIWYLVVNGTKLLPVLENMLPYLKVKKKHAELLIRYIKLRKKHRYCWGLTEEEVEIYKKLRELNQRGNTRAKPRGIKITVYKNPEEIGKKIREYRQRNNLSKRAFLEKVIGYVGSTHWLNRWESGKTIPRITVLKRMSITIPELKENYTEVSI